LDNDELVAQLEDIKATLNRVTDLLCGQIRITDAVDKVTAAGDVERRRAKFETQILEIAEANEVTPETALQGYLSGRWKRRHGDIYGRSSSWVDFEPDPGWENNSIRLRRTNIGLGGTLQVVGSIAAPLPSQARARVGILPEGYRPARSYSVAGGVLSGVTYSWSLWDLSPNGEVWTVWGHGSSGVTSIGSINAIVPLD
jgi:hypothetical protein